MIDMMLCGCNGKMGQVITTLVTQLPDCRIAAGIDKKTEIHNDYPVFSEPGSFTGHVDVIIDFSHPSLFAHTLSYAESRSVPLVMATTGLSPDQVDALKAASSKIPLFYSANMSLGVNLLIELVRKTASVLYETFDIEIVERHHNQKIDAPSGTALMIADEIAEALPYPSTYMYDRHSRRKKREKQEIGIHAVRGGTIAGEHEVIFAGLDEVLEIKHTAASKEVFAAGAIKAAKFIRIKDPGLYSMKDIVSFC